MSFHVTIFGPGHHYWRAFKTSGRVWFYRPGEHSGGGVGFCVPGLHMCFMWGLR